MQPPRPASATGGSQYRIGKPQQTCCLAGSPETEFAAELAIGRVLSYM